MRKSIIMGTKEDVIKRRAKQANTVAVHNTRSNVSPAGNSKRTIVTFNHPILGN